MTEPRSPQAAPASKAAAEILHDMYCRRGHPHPEDHSYRMLGEQMVRDLGERGYTLAAATPEPPDLSAAWRTRRVVDTRTGEQWDEPSYRQPEAALVTEPALAEALHHVMCDISHHDRAAQCSQRRKYENIAASAFPRLLAQQPGWARAEQPDHPYETRGPDNVCVHCGQIGSYAHTLEAQAQFRAGQPDAGGLRAEIAALHVYGEDKGWDFIKRTEVLRILDAARLSAVSGTEEGTK